MAARNRVPDILLQHLQVPSTQSLTLLTGTLECNAAWLTARLAISTLQDPEARKLVFVSWGQDETLWRSQLSHTLGTDVARLDKDGHSFIFIDQLKEALTPQRSTQASLQDLENQIVSSLEKCLVSDQQSGVVLILDQIDLLLATNPAIDAFELSELAMKLRTLPQVYATVMTLSAELSSLGVQDASSTTLDIALSSFAIQQAHMASKIMSCRAMKSGSAHDVSGILRITAGGSPEEAQQSFEMRYLVQRDGAVKAVD